MRRVELFELIRSDARTGASIRSLADKHQVHRRAVRQALASAVPPEPKRPERPRPALTPEVRSFIDAVLQADKQAPRKQRHTARRIFQRIRDELGAAVGETTVRAYVADRRREMGVGTQVYVPQHHPAGRQGEVDFYEADVDFPWGRETAQVVVVRSEASGAELHRAYPRQTQSALLDAMARSLEHLGGTFEVMRFDNLRQAVARVLQGRRRVEQDRFIAFRSHYGFHSSFTTPGVQGAHEKGGVENEVGRFRRRWLVPVPRMESWEAFNDHLLACCLKDLNRRIDRHPETVGEAAQAERPLLGPLPDEPFDVGELTRVGVDAKSRVSVRTNRYSVPVSLVGREVGIRLTPWAVEISHAGAVVATHPRLHLRFAERLVVDHYLDLLVERPGAFAGSLALHQERVRGAFSADHEALWARLKERWGERDGTRHMVEVLLEYRRHPRTVVNVAVAAAVDLGASDHRAVAQLCRHASDPPASSAAPIEVGTLHRYDRPLPETTDYDRLLAQVST